MWPSPEMCGVILAQKSDQIALKQPTSHLLLQGHFLIFSAASLLSSTMGKSRICVHFTKLSEVY